MADGLWSICIIVELCITHHLHHFIFDAIKWRVIKLCDCADEVTIRCLYSNLWPFLWSIEIFLNYKKKYSHPRSLITTGIICKIWNPKINCNQIKRSLNSYNKFPHYSLYNLKSIETNEFECGEKQWKRENGK